VEENGVTKAYTHWLTTFPSPTSKRMFADASSLANKLRNELSSAPPSVSERYGGTQRATLMTFVFWLGMYVAVGIGAPKGVLCKGAEGIACPGCGLGISTKAMKGGVGVADVALLDTQPELNNMHKIKTKYGMPCE
jgi:hypothetical protein